jgi:hypothetical protein
MRPQEGRDGGMNVGRSSSFACALLRCTRILHKLGLSQKANGLLTPKEVAQVAATPWEELLSTRQKPNTSSFGGVTWDEGCQKWRAYVRLDGKKHHLGSFTADEEAEAARVVDRALLIIHDGFVRDPSK